MFRHPAPRLSKEQDANFRIKDNGNGTYEIQQKDNYLHEFNTSPNGWETIKHFWNFETLDQVQKELERFKNMERTEPKYYY